MGDTYSWGDASGWFDELCDIWIDKVDLRWARKAWEGIINHGLASYSNQVEEQGVLVRIAALAYMYREFCALAWEEWIEPDCYDWARYLQLNSFRLGQLVGQSLDPDDYLPNEEGQLWSDLLPILVDHVRTEVYRLHSPASAQNRSSLPICTPVGIQKNLNGKTTSMRMTMDQSLKIRLNLQRARTKVIGL